MLVLLQTYHRDWLQGLALFAMPVRHTVHGTTRPRSTISILEAARFVMLCLMQERWLNHASIHCGGDGKVSRL